MMPSGSGLVTVFGGSGFVGTQVVRALARRGLRVPTKLLVALVVLFVCFKGFVLAAIGPTAYDSRLDSLAQGTVIEQAGAWVLQVDPVTQTLARKLGPVFRG